MCCIRCGKMIIYEPRELTHNTMLCIASCGKCDPMMPQTHQGYMLELWFKYLETQISAAMELKDVFGLELQFDGLHLILFQVVRDELFQEDAFMPINVYIRSDFDAVVKDCVARSEYTTKTVKPTTVKPPVLIKHQKPTHRNAQKRLQIIPVVYKAVEYLEL